MKKSKFSLMLRNFWVRYRMVTRPDSYLKTTGFIKSHQHLAPIDDSGHPIPWMNYAFVEFLNARLKKEHELFEYGAGFSTHYFAGRIKRVVSVEYDRSWEKEVMAMLKDVANAEVVFEEVGEKYINAPVLRNEKFDIILVDGRERVACTEAAFKALKPNGVVILDDSDREEYQKAFHIAERNGYKSLSITGLKPFSFRKEQSTVFYQSGNCLGI